MKIESFRRTIASGETSPCPTSNPSLPGGSGADHDAPRVSGATRASGPLILEHYEVQHLARAVVACPRE